MLKRDTLQEFEDILKRREIQHMMHQAVISHVCAKGEKENIAK